MNRQWQVRAESVTGAVMMFGLAAPDGDQAFEKALQRLPFDPHKISVTEIENRCNR